VRSAYVTCVLRAPKEVLVGAGIAVDYALHYSDLLAERTNKDWIGLFVLDNRDPADCGSVPVPVHELKVPPVGAKAKAAEGVRGWWAGGVVCECGRGVGRLGALPACVV
jgi:hypothetical protein